MRRKKTAVKVTLRFRMLDTGKEALYLDFYPPIINTETKKESRRESLGMYVHPLKNRNGEYTKDKNGKYRYNSFDLETIRFAETIRGNRQNELDKANIYTDNEAEILKAKERSKGDFLQFFKQLSDEKREVNQETWNSALKHLIIYTKKTEKRKPSVFVILHCNGARDSRTIC